MNTDGRSVSEVGQQFNPYSFFPEILISGPICRYPKLARTAHGRRARYAGASLKSSPVAIERASEVQAKLRQACYRFLK